MERNEQKKKEKKGGRQIVKRGEHQNVRKLLELKMMIGVAISASIVSIKKNRIKILFKGVECDKCLKTYNLKCIPKSYIDSLELSKSDDEIGGLLFLWHICTEFDSDNEMNW